jgi:branched-chain amino acid transport system substrate-binding protein
VLLSEKDATDAILAGGGQVLGSTKHPTNPSDMSSFLLKAQSSNAQVIALANAGGDTDNGGKSSI